MNKPDLTAKLAAIDVKLSERLASARDAFDDYRDVLDNANAAILCALTAKEGQAK